MAMTKLLVHLPIPLKAKLDSLRAQGYTASGYIRALLEQEFSHDSPTKGGPHDGTQRTPRSGIVE